MNGEVQTEATGGLKERLLAAGREILEKRGLEALSLRAVARAAGVSHMAPYRHFADKDALLAAIAARGFSELTEAMDRAAAGESDAMRRLEAIGVAYVLFALDNPALYRLMFGAGIGNMARFEELAQAGAAAFSHCREALAAVQAEKGASTGGQSDAALRTGAITLWSLVHGLASLALDGRVSLPTDDPTALRAAIESILTSCLPNT